MCTLDIASIGLIPYPCPNIVETMAAMAVLVAAVTDTGGKVRTMSDIAEELCSDNMAKERHLNMQHQPDAKMAPYELASIDLNPADDSGAVAYVFIRAYRDNGDHCTVRVEYGNDGDYRDPVSFTYKGE